MKKLILLMLLSLMVVSMMGCQSKAEKEAEQEAERVEIARVLKAEKLETEKRILEETFIEQQNNLEIDLEKITEIVKDTYPGFIQILNWGSHGTGNKDHLGAWRVNIEVKESNSLYSNMSDISLDVFLDIESIEFDEESNITNINYEWSFVDTEWTERYSYVWNMPTNWFGKRKDPDSDGYITTGVKITNFDSDTKTLVFEFAMGSLDKNEKPVDRPLKGFGSFEVPNSVYSWQDYANNPAYDVGNFEVFDGVLKVEKPSIGSWTTYNEYYGSIVFYVTPEGDIKLNIFDVDFLKPVDSEVVSFEMVY